MWPASSFLTASRMAIESHSTWKPALQRVAMLYIFFLFAMMACVSTWMLGGVGTAVYAVVKETCAAMDLHVRGERSEWLDSIFSCADIQEASSGLNTAMESANLAVADANDEIDGKVPCWMCRWAECWNWAGCWPVRM